MWFDWPQDCEMKYVRLYDCGRQVVLMMNMGLEMGGTHWTNWCSGWIGLSFHPLLSIHDDHLLISSPSINVSINFYKWPYSWGEFIYSHILEEHNKISQLRTSGLKLWQYNWFIFWQRQNTINNRRFVHQMSIILLHIFCGTHCNIFTIVVCTDINYFMSTILIILLSVHLHVGLLSPLASN